MNAVLCRLDQAERERFWDAEFARHAGRHADVTVRSTRSIAESSRMVLGSSIATFQLGEDGSGEHLMAAARLHGGSDTYVRALGYFIREEQEHGRLLALVLSAIDVPLRTGHWSDSAFVVIRRLRSLRTEVLTLLIAELIAHRYYSALRDGIAEPAVAAVFGRIHADEVRHLEFHAETFPPYLDAWSLPVKWAMRILWNAAVMGASVLVAVDHNGALRCVNVSAWSFVVDVWKLRVAYDKRLWQKSPPAAQ